MGCSLKSICESRQVSEYFWQFSVGCYLMKCYLEGKILYRVVLDVKSWKVWEPLLYRKWLQQDCLQTHQVEAHVCGCDKLTLVTVTSRANRWYIINSWLQLCFSVLLTIWRAVTEWAGWNIQHKNFWVLSPSQCPVGHWGVSKSAWGVVRGVGAFLVQWTIIVYDASQCGHMVTYTHPHLQVLL